MVDEAGEADRFDFGDFGRISPFDVSFFDAFASSPLFACCNGFVIGFGDFDRDLDLEESSASRRRFFDAVFSFSSLARLFCCNKVN